LESELKYAKKPMIEIHNLQVNRKNSIGWMMSKKESRLLLCRERKERGTEGICAKTYIKRNDAACRHTA